jgi:hypothetical protein
MNLYPAAAFIRHLLTARSAAGHGVHSPFVFDFLTNVVRGNSDADTIVEVETLRQEMLADRRTVRVTDLGAGSARGLGEERSIRDVASLAALPPRQVALLSRIAASMRERLHCGLNHVVQLDEGDREPDIPGVPPRATHPDSPGIILELGSSLGISTLALSLAAPGKRVVTVEGCPALAEIARGNLLRHGAGNAEVMNMEFSEALETLRINGTTVSMAFIDGNHRGEALKQYAETIRSMGEEMLIVADDIHLNRDMYSAWSSLATPGKGAQAGGAKSPRGIILPPVPPQITPATMETFRFGILFCLRNITPGHYRIRY